MTDKLYITAMQSYMLDKNVTQDELAKSLHVTPSALGKWLLGRNGISARSRKRIKDVCGKYFSNMSESNFTPSALDLISSFERSALAQRDGSPLIGAIEQFRHLVICKVLEFDMPLETQRDLVRAISNIDFDYNLWK